MDGGNSYRHSIEAALASTAASLPWWAAQSEELVIRIGAVCGALLAIARLIQVTILFIRRRRVVNPILVDEERP